MGCKKGLRVAGWMVMELKGWRVRTGGGDVCTVQCTCKVGECILVKIE